MPVLRRYFSWCSGASLAFAGSVALGYLTPLWRGELRLNHPAGVWCVVLGAIYALLGTLDYTRCGFRAHAARRMAFFCIEAGLLAGIFVTSRFAEQIFLCVFPLVVATVMLFEPRPALAGVVVLFALTAEMQVGYYQRESLVPFLSGMIPAFTFVVLFTRIAAREKSARSRAEALADEVERLAVNQERIRLAREIHDSLGHFLTTIHVQLEGAQAVHASDPARALEAVAKAQNLAREALVEVRRSVGALQEDSPPAPLAARLRDLAMATDGWGAAVSLEILGEPRALAREADHALFRAVQEGLTNVRKHARAATARLSLDYREPERVCVRLVDDGCGPGGGTGGRGLTGLRERVRAVGGRVVAEGAPGGGFCLEVEVVA